MNPAVEYHKETVKCRKCGKEIHFPASGLNHGKIVAMMGATMDCDNCQSPRAKMLLAMAQQRKGSPQ